MLVAKDSCWDCVSNSVLPHLTSLFCLLYLPRVFMVCVACLSNLNQLFCLMRTTLILKVSFLNTILVRVSIISLLILRLLGTFMVEVFLASLACPLHSWVPWGDLFLWGRLQACWCWCCWLEMWTAEMFYQARQGQKQYQHYHKYQHNDQQYHNINQYHNNYNHFSSS